MEKKAITEENLSWNPIPVSRKFIFKYGILREVLFFKENGEKFSIIVTFDNFGYHLSDNGGFRFKGSFDSFEEARNSIEDFIKTDLNDSFLNLLPVEDFEPCIHSKLRKADGSVSLFKDFFSEKISFPKGLKLKLCNIVPEATFEEWLENYRSYQKWLRQMETAPEERHLPGGLNSVRISSPDEAKQRMARLGFSEVFLEIADGNIPAGLIANKVDQFYSILPALAETFPSTENYLPLWEMKNGAVVAYDLKRGDYYRFSFVDGTSEVRIADSYQAFIAETLSLADEGGCSYADLENLAVRFNFSRLREFRAFRERRKTIRDAPPRFGEYLSLRQTNPDEFLREEIRAFRADKENDLNPKGEILQNLEADFENPLVLDFLLEVISNPNESHFARTEALLILQVRKVSSPEKQVLVGRRLVEVIRDDSNDEVRKWAGIAARNYVQIPEVLAILVEIIADRACRKCARVYCLSAIEFLDPSPQFTATLESLRKDRKIGWAISNTLAQWANRKVQ